MEQVLVMGVALGLNLVVIMYKLRKERYLDGVLDGAILISLGLLMSGTITGLMTATVGSSIVSLYLFAFPPSFTSLDGDNKSRGYKTFAEAKEEGYDY